MSNETAIQVVPQAAEIVAQVAPDNQSMLQAVMQAALNPAVDPAKMRELLEIGRSIELDQKRQEFNVDFAAAYNAIAQIKIAKNGEIIYPGKSGGAASKIKFIRHDDLSRVIKPALAAHNLTATYSAEVIATPPKLVTVMTIVHANGYSREWRSVPLPMVDSGGGKNDVQGAGSVSTYGRRYVTIQSFDIVAEGDDDDGNKGRGEPAITEDQAIKIDEILSSLEDQTPGRRAKFTDWAKQRFKIESIRELRAANLDEVMMGLASAQKQGGRK